MSFVLCFARITVYSLCHLKSGFDEKRFWQFTLPRQSAHFAQPSSRAFHDWRIIMIEERWLPIKGFEQRYEISSDGRVRSLLTGHQNQWQPGHILKPSLNGDGYYFVRLTREDGTRVAKLLHRLMAIAFLAPSYGKEKVNHLDGIKQNFKLSNLEWATPGENTRHAASIGLMAAGERCHLSKLTEEQVIEIKQNSNRESRKELAKRFNVKYGTIRSIQRGISWNSKWSFRRTGTVKTVPIPRINQPPANGEGHGRAKLKWTDVKIIRRLVSFVRRKDLANAFGVSMGTIDCIQYRKTWLSEPEQEFHSGDGI